MQTRLTILKEFLENHELLTKRVDLLEARRENCDDSLNALFDDGEEVSVQLIELGEKQEAFEARVETQFKELSVRRSKIIKIMQSFHNVMRFEEDISAIETKILNIEPKIKSLAKLSKPLQEIRNDVKLLSINISELKKETLHHDSAVKRVMVNGESIDEMCKVVSQLQKDIGSIKTRNNVLWFVIYAIIFPLCCLVYWVFAVFGYWYSTALWTSFVLLFVICYISNGSTLK